MSRYKRPWWLVVNKTASLTTTIQEEAHPGERIFVIRGEPLVQGLAWLIWGPIAALLVVGVLIWLAISLDIRAQSGAVRALIILALLILPALAWGVVALVLHLFSKKHVQAERQAGLQECFIRLDQKRATLFYQTTTHPTQEKVEYSQIQQVRVAPTIGSQDITEMRLLLETDDGPIVLLNQKLGTLSQKNDLAQELERALTSTTEK
jgi:hypothetical protein